MGGQNVADETTCDDGNDDTDEDKCKDGQCIGIAGCQCPADYPFCWIGATAQCYPTPRHWRFSENVCLGNCTMHHDTYEPSGASKCFSWAALAMVMVVVNSLMAIHGDD